MILLHQLAVRALDLPLVRVARDAQDLVVVLGLAPPEVDLGLLLYGVDDAGFVGVGLFGLVERVGGWLVVLGVGESLGAVEEAVEGVFVEFEGLFAVIGGFVVVGLSKDC